MIRRNINTITIDDPLSDVYLSPNLLLSLKKYIQRQRHKRVEMKKQHRLERNINYSEITYFPSLIVFFFLFFLLKRTSFYTLHLLATSL